MIWFVVMQVFSVSLEWLCLGRKTEHEKDLEILLLRRQLAILERKLDKPLKVSRAEKLPLVVLLARLRAVSQRTPSQLREVIRIFQPQTVIKWHREAVRLKWNVSPEASRRASAEVGGIGAVGHPPGAEKQRLGQRPDRGRMP